MSSITIFLFSLLSFIEFVVLGLLLGSFVNVWVVRVNEDDGLIWKEILFGRSRCPKCRKTIVWRDNIPLLSFFLLGGKCRHCFKAISWQYPLVELSGGIIMASVFIWSDYLQALFFWGFTGWVVFLFLLLALFVSDLRFMTLPTIFSYPLLFGILGFRVFQNWGDMANILPYLISGLGAFVFFYLVWLVTRGRGMGYGDVEYAFIMGMILGFPGILVGLMFAFVSGALVGLGLIASGKSRLSTKLPFGPFLIMATLVSIFWGDRIINWYLLQLA